MGTEPGNSNHPVREINVLMRLLINLNAGVMLALCIWLSWAAMDHNARYSQGAAVIPLNGCGCSLGEMKDGLRKPDVAARQ